MKRYYLILFGTLERVIEADAMDTSSYGYHYLYNLIPGQNRTYVAYLPIANTAILKIEDITPVSKLSSKEVSELPF